MTAIPTAETLCELLRARADRDGDTVALTFLADSGAVADRITYGELDRRARILAARLQRSGAAGARALLLYPPGLDYVAALFGCFYAGTIAVPAYPPDLSRAGRTLPRLRAIARDARATLALTTGAILPLVPALGALAPDLAGLPWLATEPEHLDPAGTLAAAWRPPETDGHSIAFLQYTSGSTSSPRGVMLSHGNLLDNSAFIHRGFGHGADTRVLVWLPPYHDMGLIGGILQPLYGGFPGFLMSPMAFLQQPARWLRAISDHGANVSGAPNFAYDLCVRRVRPEQLVGVDLSRWALAFNGAEPVREATMDAFSAAFAPHGFDRRAFYPCYGLAESTLAVTVSRRGAGARAASFQASALERGDAVEPTAGGGEVVRLASSGRPGVAGELLIVDPDTREPCPPRRVGEIWIASPSVAGGYWNQLDDGDATFAAHLRDGRGPYLRSGDLGFIHGGELFVTGRIKDVLIIRGRNLYPQDIELVVERSHASIRPSCGAAFTIDRGGTGELAILYEAEPAEDTSWPDVVDAIRRSIARAIDVRIHAVTLVPPRTIPKTSSGKVQRWLCRAEFLKDDATALWRWRLDDPATPTQEPCHGARS